jgi:hypothetical protein
MRYVHGVESSEGGVAYTLDPIKTPMDTLHNRMCGVVVPDVNNDRIDGQRSDPPGGVPPSCTPLGDANLQRIADGRDETGENVRFYIRKSSDSSEDDCA